MAQRRPNSLGSTVRSTARGGPHVEAIETDRGAQPLALGPPDRPGTVSVFTCPECSGTLWETDEGELPRFHMLPSIPLSVRGAADLTHEAGGILVFDEPIGSGPVEISARVLAFCLVIAGAAPK